MDSGNTEGSKSVNEKRQTTMTSCMGKLLDHLYLF
jgi:ATP-dependent RNA helicase DHX29